MLKLFMNWIKKIILNQLLNIIFVLCLYFVILNSEVKVLPFIPNCLRFILIKPEFMNNNKDVFDTINNFALSFISAIIIYNITKKIEEDKNKAKLSISYPILYKYIYDFRQFVLSMYKCSINKSDVEDFIFDRYEWAVYNNYKFIKNIKKELLSPYGDVNKIWDWETCVVIKTLTYVNNIDRYFELYKDVMPIKFYNIFVSFLKHEKRDIPSMLVIVKKFPFSNILALLDYADIMKFTYKVLIYLNKNSILEYQTVNKEQYLNDARKYSFNSGVVKNA